MTDAQREHVEQLAEAKNVRLSLALRVEGDWPAVAAAILESLPPRIDRGELILRYGPSKMFCFRQVKRHERELARYCELGVRVELTGV